jgi:ornithine cyclodeaminase/alanine dehydrogenase-like protein (mu-crystallin family)
MIYVTGNGDRGMTWIFSNDELDRVLAMDACIDALATGYRDLAAGRGGNRGRAEIVSPAGEDGTVYALKSMDGVHTPSGFASIRLNSDIIGWREAAGSTRRVKIPAAPGDRYVGLVLLFSTHNGEPLAIFPDGVVQRMRVAATSALGVRHLAREDARCAALIGTGWQAGSQAMALCAVRPIERIRCYSPNRAHREAFAAEMRGRLQREVLAVDSPDAALDGADIVACATSALDPVITGRQVHPGVHYTSIKPAEIAPSALAACDRVAVHLRDNAPHIVRTHGVVLAEDRKGALAPDARIDEARLPELAELITGTAPGRAAENEATCFLNYSGSGYQFTLVGGVAYQAARAAGLGRELPTEWFTQHEHP